MKRMSVRLAIVLFVASFARLTAFEAWPVVRQIATLDQNGDGRPDVWRHFDGRGDVSEVEIDTNFDGKPDVEEYYVGGVLVRRESDRNFNGQADLVEEFDSVTRVQTRSVVDSDYDGTADLLILFLDGRPVFSKRASSPNSRPGSHPSAPGSASLVPLTDPFQSETAIHNARVGSGIVPGIGLASSGGLPLPRATDGGRPVVSVGTLALASVHPRPSALLLLRSPRAPPLA